MDGDQVTAEELEALRAHLTGYCYRLLASAADAEDAVQEALIRASAKIDRFDPARGRLSTWVHTIATNICLDMLRAARRRALVMDVGSTEGALGEGAALGAGAALGEPLPPAAWVEPMPDSLLSSAPEGRALARESVRLAFVAALQRLTPRQRAVLVLRDVLAFSARETAEIVDATTASVNSALQRARATLDSERPDAWELAEPHESDQQVLLERYVAAFEAHDVAELTRLLREDAIASMPPFAWSLSGGARIAEAVGASDSCAGARLVPCGLNGGLGFGQYRPDESGRIVPFALVAVDVRAGQISRMVTFLGTEERFAEFGLPTSLSDSFVPSDEFSPAGSYHV